MFLIGFPLLIIPFAVYNMIAFLLPGVSWTDRIATIHMLSGADWTMTIGDALLLLGLAILFIEILKATRSGVKSVIDHGLSTLVFIGALIEFLVVKQAASSIFGALVVIALFDVVGGYSVTIRTAQRDYTVERVEP